MRSILPLTMVPHDTLASAIPPTKIKAGGEAVALHLGGALNRPVSIGGAVVMPGDAVLRDDTGVLVLPPGEAEAEARRAIEKQASGLATRSACSVARSWAS